MDIHIPEWALWTVGLVVGVPAVIALLGFAVLGVVLVKGIGRGPWP